MNKPVTPRMAREWAYLGPRFGCKLWHGDKLKMTGNWVGFLGDYSPTILNVAVLLFMMGSKVYNRIAIEYIKILQKNICLKAKEGMKNFSTGLYICRKLGIDTICNVRYAFSSEVTAVKHSHVYYPLPPSFKDAVILWHYTVGAIVQYIPTQFPALRDSSRAPANNEQNPDLFSIKHKTKCSFTVGRSLWHGGVDIIAGKGPDRLQDLPWSCPPVYTPTTLPLLLTPLPITPRVLIL